MTILNTASLASITHRLAAQSVRIVATTPHATLSTTSAQAHQPLLLARPKQRELVALEVVQVPAPTNVLLHMGENAALTMLSAVLALAFPCQRQLQALLSPNSHPDVLQVRLRVQLHWEEDAAIAD